MKHITRHKPSGTRAERSIFGTIFNAMVSVLLVEVALLVASIYVMRVGPQLDQNAEDILAMQVENRSRYIQTILNDAQELSTLESEINALTQELLDSGRIDLATLDSSSITAYPLLEAATPKLIAALRSRPVTGIFLVLNTHDLNERSAGKRLPSIYLRDLDPDASLSDNNSDLLFERAPAQLVQEQSIATDKSWSPALTYQAKARGYLYAPFQAAYDDGAQLSPADYGHWTITPYALKGDDRQAIYYSQPLILPDGTVYGVIGVELLTSYLAEKLPCAELQGDGSGFYLLACSNVTLSPDTLSLDLAPVLCSGSSAFASGTTAAASRRGTGCFRLVQDHVTYTASVMPLNLYNRNAPFSGDHWCLVGMVPTANLSAFSNRVQQLLFLTVLLTLIAGFLASFLVSERMSKPVHQLSAAVAKAQENAVAMPQLPTTGIMEVDQFASAITHLSEDVLSSSTRFLRIMEIATVELGGYELRSDSVFATDNFFQMLGLATPEPLTPRSFRNALSRIAHSSLYRTTDAGNSVFLVQKENEVRYVILRVTRICGETASEVGLLEDVTIPTLEQQRIERERDYDILTGLYNRQAFNRVCADLFAHPAQLHCSALLMMDLDNLKQINDTYGHDWGDQYIHQTGQCFAANTSKNTICSRLSGDEFLLLFYGYDTQDAIRAELDKLSAALRASCSTLPNGKTLNISISGGVAWYPEDGKDLKTLKKYADFAMYQVKQSRKGQVGDFDIGVYHREEYAAQTQREFLQLLQEEQVYYYFQPIFSAQTGRVVAYEALMRVNTPTLTSPSQVMALAHELDRLYDIERITMFHSSEAFEKLQSRGLIRKDALLFVNSIANVDLNDADIQEYHRRYPDLLKQLVVEITEQEDLDRACLERKRNIPGFSGAFALDDYGTGYSNELNLLELSPQYIKIDLSIIRGIEKDLDKQQIVSNTVAYAHARSMQILAEGIEEEIQLRKVIDLGVDLLQGYYLSRPAAVPSPIASEALDVIRAASAAHSDAG